MNSVGQESVGNARHNTESSQHLPDSALLTPGALTIDCLQTPDAFDRLQLVWQALERSDTQCMPANTWQWASLWWEHYATRHDTLVLLTARHGKRVVAIAPFYIDSGRMCRVVPVKVLRFIGSGRDTSPDYLNIVALPHARKAAEAAFLEHLLTIRGWQKLYLSDMREESSLVDCVRAFVKRQSGALTPERKNTLMRASLPDSWDQYRANLSRKRRKQINHRQNRLDAAGRSELSLCASPTELAEASDALAHLHRLRWQSKGEPGAFITESYEKFHRAVIRKFFASDALWLATLKLDGQIIGVQYILVWRGELQFFQSGYSPDHESLSPGHVLFTYVIKRGIEQGMTDIDMLKGYYEYKSAYARDSVTTCDVGFIRTGIRSMLGHCLRMAKSTQQAFSKTPRDAQ